ncbi:hypothetical protein ACI5KX_00425 [Erythrobacter sp. GH1-10]|uniref:hypothetical protein n=1 Tax=Erythrobacter sp. GH1-10 TaxID=3349334 RepID=UPI00387806BA
MKMFDRLAKTLALALCVSSAAAAPSAQAQDRKDIPGTVWQQAVGEADARVRKLPAACILNWNNRVGDGFAMLAGSSRFTNQLIIIGPDMGRLGFDDFTLTVTRDSAAEAFSATFSKDELPMTDGSVAWRYSAYLDSLMLDFSDLEDARALTLVPESGSARPYTVAFEGALRDTAVAEMQQCIGSLEQVWTTDKAG